MVCHYWFLNYGLKFQGCVSNGCHDLLMHCVNISNIAVITVKGADYCCIIYVITKSNAITLLKNYVLADRGYI